MILKKFSDLKLYFFFITVFHLLFFKFYLSDLVPFGGTDSITIHYASKYFLYENLKQGVFPIWTDRMAGNYPVFFEPQYGYQNIINIALVYFFGPIWSVKILFLLTYLIGSFSLFKLLKILFNSNLPILLISNLLYFYSAINLFHLEHHNFIVIFFLYPTLIHLTNLFIQSNKILYSLLITFLLYFWITFGSYQIVLIAILGQILYIYVKNNSFLKTLKYSLILIVPGLFITLPTTFYLYKLFSISERVVRDDIYEQGRFSIFTLASYFIPYVFGISKYRGMEFDVYSYFQESNLYFPLSVFILVLLFLSKNLKTFAGKFFIGTVIVFFIINMLNVPPLSFFRFWGRGVFIVNFAAVFCLASFYPQLKEIKINKIFLLSLIGVFLLNSLALINPKFRLIFLQNLNENSTYFINFALIIMLALGFLFIKPKYYLYIILLDLLLYLSVLPIRMYLPTQYIESLSTSQNVYEDTRDGFSLIRQGPSHSIYAAMVPRDEITNLNSLFLIHEYILYLLICIIIVVIYYKIIYKRILNNL